jgi:ribosome-binding protein aMBF1 (putative translation factor)
MECPQCGGSLNTYALDGSEASVCPDCGYVGIPAEHRKTAPDPETWDEAVRRFYRAHGIDGDGRVELRPRLFRPAGTEVESWDEAIRRFHERQTADGDDATDANTGGERGGDAEGGTADDGDTAEPESGRQSSAEDS